MANQKTARSTALADLRSRPRTQVLVIGGGINGIAILRDLAMQGIDVVIIDRADFASGASAASSHMIHGGIRYLENGEFRLVRESVQERNRLLRLAPHFVRPLETTIPIFSTFSGLLSAPLRMLTHRQTGRPKERGAILIKVGLMIYDTFSRGGGIVPRHRFRGRGRSLNDLPRLNPKIKYTATYFDAGVEAPERLAIDVLRDGLAALPTARALNYVAAVGTDAAGVRLRDMVSGDEFTVHADLVINASGPWTDLTNAALGLTTTYLGGTKGSHIVLDHPELLAATADRELFFENNDGRIVLIYPLAGRVLVGTSDLEADPSEPAVCTPEEVDYFIDLVAQVFPDITVDRSQIVFAFSGIRPLPRHEDTAPGFVSRDYRIETDRLDAGPSVISLIGGKWTTFRAVAERVADVALTQLGRDRRRTTTETPIGGGAGFPAEADRRDWLREHLPLIPTERAEVLLTRYGTRAAEVASWLDQDDRPVLGTELSTRELSYLVEREWVVTLSDLVLRRTSLAFRGLLTLEAIDELATALAHRLGWHEGRRTAEIDALTSALARQGANLPSNERLSPPSAESPN
jgi:glycerol-3-phosphate dehydrogenase